MRTNPFANYGDLAVNTVEEWESRGLKQIGDVSTSRQFILEALHEAGVIDLDNCSVTASAPDRASSIKW